MALIVQKYGGTSVGNPERIKNVAARVANDFGRSDVLWAPGANQSESASQSEDDD